MHPHPFGASHGRLLRLGALTLFGALGAQLAHPALADTSPAPLAASPAAAVPQSASLTLTEALRLATAHNPELAGARLAVQALQGAEQQAAARPKPELSALVEDTRANTRSTTLQWAQPIELGGKRAARQTAAALAREQASVALQGKQAELRAAVSSAFADVLGAQAQVQLSLDAEALAAQATQIASKRLQAGKAAPLELAKTEVTQAQLKLGTAQAQSDLHLARQRLASFWGAATASLGRAEGSADSLPALPPDDRVARWLAQAPSLRIAQLEIARHEALIAGERARQSPDLTVTVGARRNAELGRTQAVLGITIPLLLGDNNQGQLTEAQRRQDQARQALLATSSQLQLDVAQAIAKLRLAHDEVNTLKAVLVPSAQSAYDTALKGYEAGKFAFLDVLDAQRTLVQLKQHRLHSIAQTHRAAAELQRLLGQDLASAPPAQD